MSSLHHLEFHPHLPASTPAPTPARARRLIVGKTGLVDFCSEFARDVVRRRCDDECVPSFVYANILLTCRPFIRFFAEQAQTDVRSSEVFSGCSFFCACATLWNRQQRLAAKQASPPSVLPSSRTCNLQCGKQQWLTIHLISG